MASFKQIDPKEISENTFKLIHKDWFLVTAGHKTHFNTMTAGWGAFGILWNKPIVITFIRPQRYTYEFAEKYDHFTASFFTEEHRKKLSVCGTKSGRHIDKIKETGLIPVESENGNVYFEQAKLVLECKKIYFDDLKAEHFIDASIKAHYPSHDYHRFYIGEIINCLKK